MVILVLGRVGPGNLGPQDTIKLVYVPFKSILIDLKQKENRKIGKSYYKSSSVCLFVCLSVCLFVPYLLRGPLTDLRQTWWVYVGGPRNCP